MNAKSIAAAALIPLLAIGALFLLDRCYVRNDLLTIIVCAVGWSVAYLASPKKIRLALIAAAPLALLIPPHPEFTPSVEASAVCTLRNTATFLNTYKTAHPKQGYPPTATIVPCCRVRGLYEFSYEPRFSSEPNNFDRYIITAIPVPSAAARGMRSFTWAEDGHLYACEGDLRRAATRQDRILQ